MEFYCVIFVAYSLFLWIFFHRDFKINKSITIEFLLIDKNPIDTENLLAPMEAASFLLERGGGA